MLEKDFVAVARQAAKDAGSLLQEMFGQLKASDIENKGEIDLVTAADKAAEEQIVNFLSGHFPAHSILAEERGKTAGSSDYFWIIDPLDGTTNYAHSFPWYSVSIALCRGEETLVGVVYHCGRDEMFVAEKGSGAYCNGERISVSKTDRMIEGLFVTGFPYDVATAEVDNVRQASSVLKQSRGLRRTGSAALDLCYVAKGVFDGFWEFKLNPWDMLAGNLLVAEAGGKVTDPFGEELPIAKGDVVASNGILHEQLLKALA